MALFLRERGYQAWALTGGFRGWLARGYPTEPKEVEMETTLEDICPECKTPMRDHV